ncbi:kinesin-related protein 10-like [Portunus trituberculatus]|uniref:kinesin-related protein 10-like n=1 Tax=Portunus trituberculatus TaxID=210409 RepID=UPI001E1D2040|nr:kinesin-related protein 10-like [Portunus trituberculatus]
MTDRVFVKASNKTIYSVAVRAAVKHFCSTQNSVAIILYGPSHTGKSRYLMGPAQHPRGILQRSFADILSYAKTVRSYFCLFRVSFIEIYNEKVEDLLITTTTTTTTPPLRLETDCGGRVVWCGAREVVITKLQELEEVYMQGHSEHVRRARRTKGRREASHTVFRIAMEGMPRYRDYKRWEEVSVSVSFLDFVTVGGVELLPALGSVTEVLRGGPAVTRSLFTLHQFVVEGQEKSVLYGARQAVLTRVLRDALVGCSNSLFLCTCSLANTTHTTHTLRFGDAAAWLVQHPTRQLYPASLLHTTTAAVLHSHQAARLFLSYPRTQGTSRSGLRKEQQQEEEQEKEEEEEEEEEDQQEEDQQEEGEQDSRVKQEVKKMLSLARTIFPINTTINTKKNELESEEEPVVVRKRGRPRKYPIRAKPFGKEHPTKIDYLALWKSRYLNTEDPRQGMRKRRDREEKFYMAGPFTLTTTSKRHGLDTFTVRGVKTGKESDDDVEKMEKRSKNKEEKKEQEQKKKKDRKGEIVNKQSQDETDEIENNPNNKNSTKQHNNNNNNNTHKQNNKTQENDANNNKSKKRKNNEKEDKRKKIKDRKRIRRRELKKEKKKKKKLDELKEDLDKIPLRERKKEKEKKEEEEEEEEEDKRRRQGMVNTVKGTITITRAWDVCVDGEATQRLASQFELDSYEPKKVRLSLSNMEYRGLKWKLDDGYVHFLRLGLWIQYFREELAVKDNAGRLVYSLPDFISLKEVFVDLYLTPYRRSSHLWRVKAVSFEDGRVYLQSSRTIARRPEKLNPKAAFTTHLMGLHTPAQDTSVRKTVVPFPGQHWQVYWAEVDGLGLLYSSPVDLIDRSARVTREAMTRHPQLAGVLQEVVSERHFMYRTHLYQAPQDTLAWKDAMWLTLLEWWADYQFGKLPTIIGGEVVGQEVTAIRLFCAHTLPQLAQAWCDKPPWETSLGERYLSSLLRFIKYWCNKRPRETLSFELQENGDVLCCKRRFKIASQHFLVNSILPDEFVRDLYPAPPPQPKPSWPGKRGRKCKPRVAPQLTRPRRVTCHWKLPRYCDVETEPPTSPPRYVFRPEMRDAGNKESDMHGLFDTGWGDNRGKTQRAGRHTRFKDKENMKPNTCGLFGWREVTGQPRTRCHVEQGSVLRPGSVPRPNTPLRTVTLED